MRFKFFLNDSFWALFSQGLTVLINLFSVYILANLLTQYNYGEFKLVTTWLALAVGIGYTGYNYILPQMIIKNEKYDLKKIFKETFYKSLPTFFILFLVAIYYLINHNNNLGLGLFWASIATPFACIAILVNVYYMGKQDFKSFALAQNFSGVLQVVVLALVTYFSENFILIISTYFISALFANCVVVYKTIRKEESEIKNEKEKTESFIDHKNKSKLNISGITLGFANQIDKLLIFHFLGAVPLAVYSLVTAMSDQSRTPIKALSVAAFPRMGREYFNKRKLFFAYFIFTLLCVLGFLILIWLYPFIFKYFFPKYLEYVYLANTATIGIIFAPSQLLYLYSQSRNDLTTLNTYAHLNTFLQIFFYTIAAFSGSLISFLIYRSLIMFISTTYQAYKIYRL